MISIMFNDIIERFHLVAISSLNLLLFYLHTHMYANVHVCTYHGVCWSSDDDLRVPETQLSLSALVESTFVHWAFLLAYSIIYFKLKSFKQQRQ